MKAGLTIRIGILASIMLGGLAGTVLFLALQQQRDLIVNLSLEEVQGKLDPVEKKTEQIRFFSNALEELHRVRAYYTDKDNGNLPDGESWKFFPGSRLDALEARLRNSLSGREELSDAQFRQMKYYSLLTYRAREAMQNSQSPEDVRATLEQYTSVGRALEWMILERTGYRTTLRNAFDGLESSYRIQTVGLFFQAYFDTSLLSPARDLDFDIKELQRQLYDPALDSERRRAIYESLQSLMQRRYRLNRLGNPEINLLAVGTDEDIRATLDSIRNRYYAKDPSPDPDYHSFSTEENEYVVSVRTLFMKPEISERAIVILSTEDSRDSQVWRRYRSEEAGLNRELQAIIAQLRAIRDSAEKPLELYRNQSYRSLYKAYDDIRQRKGAALERAIQASLSFDRQSLESLQERKKEMESAVEETEANIQSLQEEFEAARQSPEASPPPGTGDEEETESNNDDIVDRSIDRESQLQGLRRRIEEEKKAREALEKRIPAIESQLTEFFPRSSRVADAYLHLPDALLYDRAVMEFVYDPTAYMSYVGSIRNREDRQKKWNALRLWIQTACSETTSCGGIYLPFVAGNGQLIRPRYALEEVMWQFDTMPSDDLSRRALFENTAAFTRIFSDRGELDQSLRKERHRLVDMAVAVGLRLLLVALLISLFFVKRIKAIIASAERVGAGDLSTVFHYPGNDELGNLAGTLNKMTQDLRHRESMIQELSAAEQIQNQLLPAGLPERFAGALDFGSFYRASSGVGGDYFDFIEMDESRLAFCIADVTGHGPGPAMIMAMMRSHLHTLIQQGVDDPGKLLRQLNGRLYQETPAHVFITMFLAIFNRSTNTVKYGSAGHNRGYVYRKSTANVETLSSGGLPLGLEDEETFDSVLESHSVQLNNGDLLFQYTDGINEAVNVAGVQFGTDRIERILKAAGTRKPETIMASMVTNLERFTERKVMKEGATELSDDIAMILIRRR